MWFEEDLEEVEKSYKHCREKGEYCPNPCEKINVLEIKGLKDVSEMFNFITSDIKLDFEPEQTFEIFAVTDYNGFVCERKIYTHLENLLKLIKRGYYYDDPTDGIMDWKIRGEFLKKYYCGAEM